MTIDKKLHSLRVTITDNGNKIHFQKVGDQIQVITVNKDKERCIIHCDIDQLQRAINSVDLWDKKECDHVHKM